MEDQDTASHQSAWSDYWDGDSGENEQALRHPAHAALLKQHWDRIISEDMRARHGHVNFLDTASGTGVVASMALKAISAARGVSFSVFLTDYAAGALAVALARPSLAGALAFAADAAALPLQEGSIDIVTSQFGIEYAGHNAFADVAKAVAIGGSFHCVIHKKDGEIARECAQNMMVLEAVRDSALLEAFLALFSAIREGADEARVAALAKEAANAGGRVGEAIRAALPCAAREHASRLLTDMQRVMDRPGQFAVADIHNWAAGQSANLETYRLRMESMLDAALDERAMNALTDSLRAAGFTNVSTGCFKTPDGSGDVAWTLTARRGAS